MHYHHDEAGRLWAETDGQGNPILDYIWMGDIPVAMMDYTGVTERVTYLHADHLNTPRYATDETGTLVWQWSSDAFGNGAPNEDPDGDGIAISLNLRFPGQYYDAESGLHYNWNRYYDPALGRYITSDPIGLDGGLNTFGYVGGNPVKYIDPEGLCYFGSSWNWSTMSCTSNGSGYAKYPSENGMNSAFSEEYNAFTGVKTCTMKCATREFVASFIPEKTYEKGARYAFGEVAEIYVKKFTFVDFVYDSSSCWRTCRKQASCEEGGYD